MIADVERVLVQGSRMKFDSKIIAFQIVKGGTGKTTVAREFAIRANFYGAKVLCIDLDQQGNLSSAFGVDANRVPIMVDILAEGYAYQDAITKVSPGLDLLASRIENALLDDVIRLKKQKLDEVYRTPFASLKENYDLIVIDCPPNLGQSVAAVTLASDLVISPVVPENFAIAGLEVTRKALLELQDNYATEIDFKITLNKYDARTKLSQNALRLLSNHEIYRHNLLGYVRASQEFPNAVARGGSIFDTTKSTAAKEDIDQLTQALLTGKAQVAKEPSLELDLA